jgi:hypothetical protein
MRILVENYSNLYTTEPIYLCNGFKMAGCDPHLWDTNIHSAYDALDMTKPDALIIKWNSIRLNDVIQYITTNKSNSPDIFLNATGADDETLTFLKKQGFWKKIFTNDYNQVSHNIQKTWLVFPGADIFLPTQQVPNYTIDAAICSEALEPSYEFESYHKLFFGSSENDQADVTVNLGNLVSIYNRYKQFLIYGPVSFIFSQLFFDATLRANRVVIKNSKKDEEEVRTILGQLFCLDNNDNIENEVKKQIIKKHTCLNRAQQMLALMDNASSATNLNQPIESLK